MFKAVKVKKYRLWTQSVSESIPAVSVQTNRISLFLCGQICSILLRLFHLVRLQSYVLYVVFHLVTSFTMLFISLLLILLSILHCFCLVTSFLFYSSSFCQIFFFVFLRHFPDLLPCLLSRYIFSILFSLLRCLS